MTTAQAQRVRRTVWTYYKKHGRHNLPWRRTANPYAVLVSEVMLQQTQVARVIPKYHAFMKRFPTVRALAEAPLRDVLVLWQGLGYNRRAKALHDTARLILVSHKGRVPRMYDELCDLPGIGPYTAGAVCVFAYNRPYPLLETNIRTVLFHHVLQTPRKVRDTELVPLVVALEGRRAPREWYWALMDYGAYLKEQGIKTNEQSTHYARQSRFKGSDREVRGAILKALTHQNSGTQQSIARAIGMAPSRVATQLSKLEKEGLLKKRATVWSL